MLYLNGPLHLDKTVPNSDSPVIGIQSSKTGQQGEGKTLSIVLTLGIALYFEFFLYLGKLGKVGPIVVDFCQNLIII